MSSHDFAPAEKLASSPSRMPQRESQTPHESVADEVPSVVHDALHTSGQPLDDETRQGMQLRLGGDFSKVRVHTDSIAAESAAAVSARAYTVGAHIVFDRGSYSPKTAEGRRTLAHELAHVLQQEPAPVSGPLRIGAVRSAHEREADQIAAGMIGQPVTPARLHLARQPVPVSTPLPPGPLPPTGAPMRIGYVYTVRGVIDKKPVIYTGSTAREVATRLFKDNHKWSELIKAKSTTIDVHEIRGILNIEASSRGNVKAARNEALRSGEQVVLKRTRAESGAARELNAAEAAEEENILSWADRHQVTLGPKIRFRPGVRMGAQVGAFVAFALLDFFVQYRDQMLAQYATTPYILEDEKGIFTLQERDRGIFRRNWYFKNYKTGAFTGKSVQIPKDEFQGLAEEAELLWGTTDWKGDFVPGLLRQELPVIHTGA